MTIHRIAKYGQQRIHSQLNQYHFLLQILPYDFKQRGCVEGIIFVQDGAPPHIVNPVKQLLKGHFRNASYQPPFSYKLAIRSSDLNTCEFWLCSNLKDVVSD
ncbi:hypothetical protein TNCV_5039781 [Trichonephila clavipes]|nr:hypothetical protein TNCV_5039781 [Trichonephila clavipes]